MARYGISYEDVANAAQELIAQGRTPTIESIRAITGTGSSTTITIHLRTFKSKQNEMKNLVNKEHIPQELLSFVKGLWERVMTQAEALVQTIKIEVADEITQLKSHCATLLEENASWQQENERWQQQKASLLSDKSALEQLTIDLQKQVATLNATLDEVRKQAQDKQTHIEELTRQNNQVQSNLEHFREAAREQRLLDQAKFENEKRELVETIKESKQTITLQNQSLLALQNKHDLLLEDKTDLLHRYEKLTINQENTQLQLTKCEETLEKTEDAKRRWQAQHETTQAKFTELQTMHAALQEKSVTSQTLLAKTERELTEQIEQNKYQAREKWEMMQEKASLQGQLKQLQAMFEGGSVSA